MRLPLVSGITADETAEFRSSYPLNLEVVAVNNKIAAAQFRATSGAIQRATGPGTDRGGIVWNGLLYRVMGTKLVSMDTSGNVTTIGDVGGSGPAGLDFSFSDLIIRSSANLFYYNPTAGLRQVTDPDLGPVHDMMWIDGFTMTTDGTNIIVTELNDPMSVQPLKYGSAEEDPDMVTGLIKVRDEPYILGQYTIQVMQNVGGNGFPFANVKGASIPVGCVSPSAKCLFADTFAFVGSARNEALGVYLAGSGSATRISSRWVDDQLAAVADPTRVVLENRTSRGERRLFVHLPDKSLVFLMNATKILQDEPVWYVAQSGNGNPYRLRYAVEAYGKTYVGDLTSSNIGELTDTVATHFGENAAWQFDAGPIFNEGKGGVLKSVELIGLPGRISGTMFMSMTKDGETFSVERAISMGDPGERSKRLIWRPRVNFRTWLGLRFRGLNGSLPGFAACEIDADPLAR